MGACVTKDEDGVSTPGKTPDLTSSTSLGNIVELNKIKRQERVRKTTLIRRQFIANI